MSFISLGLPGSRAATVSWRDGSGTVAPHVDSPLLVLQHIACEPPAAFEDELRSRGHDLVRVELDEGEPLPDWREFPAIVVMGGPMGAYDDGEHPWLVEEKHALGEAAGADVPVWGVCLGAQLLASALGARVYRGERPEVGLLPVELAPAAAGDPVFADAPRSFPTLQWHGDTFDLPDDATLLASSPAYPN
jgi:GMP synthase (glutamine-hydrolysing)